MEKRISVNRAMTPKKNQIKKSQRETKLLSSSNKNTLKEPVLANNKKYVLKVK